MEKQENLIDYASIQQQALEQFRSGKSLTGKDGAFAPLINNFQKQRCNPNWSNTWFLMKVNLLEIVRMAK